MNRLVCPVCLEIVARLIEVLVSVGLEDLGARLVCSECLADYESQARREPMIVIEPTGRVREPRGRAA